MADVSPDAVKTARQSGYSDDEIVSFLSQKSPDQFKAAQDAGYSSKEILDHLSSTDTSYTGAVRKGFSDVVEGVGKTVKNYIDPETGSAIEAKGQKVEPSNYKSATAEFMNSGAPWYDKNWSAAPRALVEQAPGLAVDVLAGLAGKKLGGGVGALVGTGLSNYLRTRGDAAESNAAYRTNGASSEPNTEDKVRSAVTGIPEAAIGALGARGLVSPAKVASTGLRGAAESASNLAKTAGAEAAAGGAQNVVAQVGQSVGTDRGVNVDPGEVFGNAALTGLTAGGLRSVHTASDLNNARRFRDFDSDASQRVATRIQDNADGDLGNVKTARKAVGAAEVDIKSDLNQAFSSDPEAKARISADDAARRSLDRFNAGERVSDDDLSAIANAAKGSSAGERIASLTSEAVALRKLKELGSYGDDKFKGGLSHLMEKGVRAIYNPVGSLTGAGLAAAGLSQPALAAGVLSSAPAAVGGSIGAYVLARALDKATGYRSPANTFVKKFGGTGAVTPAVRPDVRQPQNPTGPRVAQAPTFNGRPFEPPFGVTPVVTPAEMAARGDRLDAGIRKVATRNALMNRAADEAQANSIESGADMIGRNAVAQVRGERRIAAMKERQDAYAERQALQAQRQDATGLVQSRNANLKVMQQDAQQTAQAKRANDTLERRGNIEQMRDARELMASRQSPNPLDRAQMADARELMAARRAHEKAQQAAERAASEAEGARQEVGSDGEISPNTLKATQKLVKSLTAVQKLKDRAEKAAAAVEKKQASQAKVTERVQAKAERDAVKEVKAQAKAAKSAAAPKTNGKANGQDKSASPKKKLADYPEAPWAYADTNREAARQVYDFEKTNGRDIAHPDGYMRSVERRLNGMDDAVFAVAKDAGSHSDKEVLQSALAQIKGTRSPAAAKEFREVLKQELPQLASSIDKHLSDGKLDELWKPARSKLH